jgi:hypothetical protein
MAGSSSEQALLASAWGSTRVTLKPSGAAELSQWRAQNRVVRELPDGRVQLARSAAHWAAEKRLAALLASAPVQVTDVPLPGVTPDQLADCIVQWHVVPVAVVVLQVLPARERAVRAALVARGVPAERAAQVPFLLPSELDEASRLQRQVVVVDQAHLLGSLEHGDWARHASGVARHVHLLGCAGVPSPRAGWCLSHFGATAAAPSSMAQVASAMLQWPRLPQLLRAARWADVRLPSGAAWRRLVRPGQAGQFTPRGVTDAALDAAVVQLAAPPAGADDVTLVLESKTAEHMGLEEWQLVATLLSHVTLVVLVLDPAAELSNDDAGAGYAYLADHVWPRCKVVFPRTVIE